MTGSAPGHQSRSEEPHCYNCGASGHWVVACPEPTRETPAGLSAWRKSASSSHGRGKDHNGGSKKSKGPIITKYAPPPPAVGALGTYYPPPPPGAYYSSPPNPQSGPFPYTPHYPPQPPSAPPSYSAAPYQPHTASYPQQHYPPSAAYTPHSYAQPPFPASIPPRPPPPIAALPARQPHHHSSRPNVHSFGPPSYPASHPPPLPSGPHSSTYRPPRPSFSPPATRASASAPPALSKPKPLPPPPLTQGIHSLPPKPPKAFHEKQDPSRGNRQKRKNERQHRNRDSRSKDQGPRNLPPGPKHGSHPGGHYPVRLSADASPPAAEDLDEVRVATGNRDEPDFASVNQDSGKKQGQESPSRPVEQSQGTQDLSDDLDDWEWDFKAIFKEPESTKQPDEVGTPLPHAYTDDVLLPRKWDSKCMVSRYIKADNLDEYTRPIHETVSWPAFEFDPAFIRDGQFPNGEPLGDYIERLVVFDFQGSENLSKGHGSDDGQLPEVTQRNSCSAVISASDASYHTETEAPEKHRKPSEGPRSSRDDQDSEPSHASPAIPRTRIRKRSRDRGRSPNTSRDSRRSSVSSQSSDLSSLEAELLGRPPKRKRSNNIPRRRRTDSHPRQQPGRWPSASNSAYSRRW